MDGGNKMVKRTSKFMRQITYMLRKVLATVNKKVTYTPSQKYIWDKSIYGINRFTNS